MAKKEKEDQDEAQEPGYVSVDHRGTWYFNKGIFPHEDPTNVGTSKKLTRFEPGTYTQAEDTSWTEAQWREGAFKKFDGHPRDEKTKEIVYVAPTPAAAAAAADTTGTGTAPRGR